MSELKKANGSLLPHCINDCVFGSFDPDILLGYDVERWSWNYAVQRAARIGRVGFLRDISRLAPGRLFPKLFSSLQIIVSIGQPDG